MVQFTSSGCAEYIGVASFNSIASRMSRFTAGQEGGAHRIDIE